MNEIYDDSINEEKETQKGRFLIFSLGEEEYGIEIQYVTEIIVIQPITEVPEIEEYIKGIINLRGKIIPVMDVRLRFKKEWRAYDDRTCIIVANVNGISLGLIIDRVSEVIAISKEDIASPPEYKGAQNKFIKGIGKVGNRVKLLLDCNKLLSNEEIENLIEMG